MATAALRVGVLCAVLCATAAAAAEGTCAKGGCGEHVFTYFPSVRAVPSGALPAVHRSVY